MKLIYHKNQRIIDLFYNNSEPRVHLVKNYIAFCNNKYNSASISQSKVSVMFTLHKEN